MNTDDIHERWVERSGDYTPEYYADMGPDETSRCLAKTLDHLVDSDAAILELGCSAGRHLAHLHEQGFENLHGIEINEGAREVMERAFPDLAADGTFHFDAIESVVTDFADGQFDVVFSVETLQHVRPENAWVFDELARITDDVLVTVENEGWTDDRIVVPTESGVDVVDDFPLYHRTWGQVFTEREFALIDSVPLEMDTFRLFRRADA